MLLGAKKMILNFLEKIFVTSDAAVILTEVYFFEYFLVYHLDRPETIFLVLFWYIIWEGPNPFF